MRQLATLQANCSQYGYKEVDTGLASRSWSSRRAPEAEPSPAACTLLPLPGRNLWLIYREQVQGFSKLKESLSLILGSEDRLLGRRLTGG